MTHKPKMISVTSCNEGAGVSSVAAGLAASLSETGEGNVLLVDMHETGTAQAFFKGRRACGLGEALIDGSRTQAQVQQNLYLVSGATPDCRLERVAHRQFGEYIPKLKASDYDYIIFDMPPVSQTSVTAKVARFMDMVLMVTEAGKTNREVMAQAVALLAESKATIATVLNKRRRYVPRWLLQEFD
jgi:Mrp family chromosome partitioning ATPase